MDRPRVNLAVLVDDNEVDLFIQKRFIELNDFANSIVTFTSPQDALAFLQSADPQTSPVIFLDLNMPIMDGFTFLERSRALPREISDRSRVVVLTSSTSSQDKEKAGLFAQVIHFMSKPLSKKDLDEIREKFFLSLEPSRVSNE